MLRYQGYVSTTRKRQLRMPLGKGPGILTQTGKEKQMDGELKLILWGIAVIAVTACSIQLFVPGGLDGFRDMLTK